MFEENNNQNIFSESPYKKVLLPIISKITTCGNDFLYYHYISILFSTMYSPSLSDFKAGRKIPIFCSLENIQKKYKMFGSILSNIFLKDFQKEELLTILSILQKGITGIRKFVYLYRYKRSMIYNTTDLCGDPIPTNNTRISMTIYQNNTRYVFLLRELIKTINTALSNSPYFFADPVPCKNPYTNIPFDKSTLYNIYFRIRLSSSLKIPELFHRYFLCDFDLYNFSLQTEELIRREYVNSYVKNIETNQIGNIREMVHHIFQHNKIFCIYIHREFPEDRLLNIMRPYISLFFRMKYSLNLSYKTHLSLILKYSLLKFVEYNKCFGRRMQKRDLRKDGKSIRILDFNDKHIEFEWPIQTVFRENHLNNDSDEMTKIYSFIKESKRWKFIKLVPTIEIKEDESESDTETVSQDTQVLDEEEAEDEEEDLDDSEEDEEYINREEENNQEQQDEEEQEGDSESESESDIGSDTDSDSEIRIII